MNDDPPANPEETTMTDRPEVDDPRVLALAKARQQLAHDNPFNVVCPPWHGLTEQEQRLSLLDARSYLHAAIKAGLVQTVQPPADRGAVEPVCVCGHPVRLHHEDVCLLAGCGCADCLEISALPEVLESVLTKRFTELGNPFSEMRRHEQGPDGWPASHPVGPRGVAEVLRELLRRLADEAQQLPQPTPAS